MFNLDLEAGKHTFNLGHNISWKDKENRNFCSLPADSHLVNKSNPSLALEPSSLGF